jgi:hypothetical protein
MVGNIQYRLTVDYGEWCTDNTNSSHVHSFPCSEMFFATKNIQHYLGGINFSVGTALAT